MADAAISIQNLKFRYRGQKRLTLDDISLEIPPGDFLVVMGPSEAGKSTLAATMNGLIPHFFKGKFQGNVTVLGRQTRDARVAELSEQVGIVFQDFEAQLFSTKVDLDVAFGPENFCLPRSVIAERIQKNLERVGLLGLRHRSPSTLSGGQKQKLAIASVLAMDPQILVMDEPTTDLDPASNEEITQGLIGLGLPYRFGFAISTALRMVPMIMANAGTIAQAQRSRGLDLDQGTVLERFRKFLPLLIPVFLSTIRNTHVWGMAIESRGFGARPTRTFYLEMKFKRADISCLIVLFGSLALATYCKIMGYGNIPGLVRF
ncbi:MAG: ATP-binding cassette domain-containing protein [Deltaproteobacteria bacterium]|nr:ATP-binding cassette domain-containing protein [Deltaproteobacteria bacterium]